MKTLPRREPRPRPSLLPVVLMAILVTLAGCSRVVGPRSFAVSSIGTDGAVWNVGVNDTSGRITAVSVDPEPAFADATDEPFNVTGSPGTLVVPWIGGACDTQTTFTIGATDGDQIAVLYQIDVAPGACAAIAIGHQLVLETSPSIPAAKVTLTRAP